MSQTNAKPLASSKNTQATVTFQDMPEEYAIVNREDVDRYAGTAEVFARRPGAQTLMVLYGDDGVTVRSAYHSTAAIRPEMRDAPEKSREAFYHTSGEKLVDLVMEVSCNLSAYGQTNVMVPQGASDEEVRGTARSRAQSFSDWEMEEDWSTVEGLRINRVVEVAQEPGKNREALSASLWNANSITADIPVEFAPSRSGEGIFEMLKSAERGTFIPPEVFMYAAARQTQKAGVEFTPEFIDNLKSEAESASKSAVSRQMMTGASLNSGMMVVLPGSEDVLEYNSGSVLRVLGAPDSPVEYKVYQDKRDADNFVLAGVINKDVVVDYPDETSLRVDTGAIHVIVGDPFMGDTYYLEPEEFHARFVASSKTDAEAALVNHFGYRSHTSPQKNPDNSDEVCFAGPMPTTGNDQEPVSTDANAIRPS
jgi:hypothetical protein